MKLSTYILFSVIGLLMTTISYAQIDNKEEKAVPLGKGNEDKKADSALFDTKLTPSKPINADKKVNGLTVPQSIAIKPQTKEFSMFGEQFGNPAELYEDRLKKHQKAFESPEKKQYGSTTDVFFGDFKTKSEYVRIIFRDHGYPDGDRVRILVNGDVVVSDVTLTTGFNGFRLNLIEGFNRIEFVALNTGDSGPNTAEFQVIDDTGSTISGNRWNLATGVKASIIVVKEADESSTAPTTD